MLNFQRGINQLLNITAAGTALWAHSPQGESVIKGRELKAEENKLSEALQTAQESQEENRSSRTKEGRIAGEQVQNIKSLQAENALSQFRNNPTKENFKKVLSTQKDPRAIREKAMQRMAQNGINQVDQANRYSELIDRIKSDNHPAINADTFKSLSPEKQRDVLERLSGDKIKSLREEDK